MTQVPLFLGLYLLGVSLCLVIGPRQRPLLCAALGFPVGLAAALGVVLVMLGAGVPVSPLSAALPAVAITAVCVVIARPPRATWSIVLPWAVGFTAVALLLTRYNFSILTYDSHYIIIMGRILGEDGAFAPSVLERLGDYGVFQPLAQSLFIYTREEFLWGLAPVFAASMVALFAVVLSTALDALGARFRRRWLVVALVTAATFSTYMVLRHSFYIQTNFGTASYLFLFCTLYWLSEVEGSTDLLPLAFVALTALALHRIEAPLVCVLFLSLTVLPSRLPRRTVLPLLGGFTAAVVAWNLLLASGVQPSSEFLTPKRCYLLAAVVVAFFAYAAVSSWTPLGFLGRLNRHVHILVGGVGALALVVTFSLRYEHMYQSASAWLQCLVLAPYWQGVWPAIVLLALLGLFVPAPPSRWLFVVGLPAYFALILLLVWERTPYYWGMGDSASRMAVHLVPLAFFYLALTYIPLLGRRTDTPAAS